MGLFSFGKKDDAPRRQGGRARSERVERRSRRTERAAGESDAMLLDPTLPEKQRARRRLVGAIALVIGAVVILPMVLDSHPRPVTNDIAIDIPNRPSTVPSHASGGTTPDMPAMSPQTADATGQAATSGKSAAKVQAPAKPAKEDTAGGKSGRSAPSKAPSAAHSEDTASRSNASASATGTPSSPAGARFAVQLGAFANEANARRWEKKLKAVGVPAYVEHRKQADGSTRALLRAGPFVDRAAASAAIAKVREAGLTANASH